LEQQQRSSSGHYLWQLLAELFLMRASRQSLRLCRGSWGWGATPMAVLLQSLLLLLQVEAQAAALMQSSSSRAGR
jgi:hypothetical protein